MARIGHWVLEDPKVPIGAAGLVLNPMTACVMGRPYSGFCNDPMGWNLDKASLPTLPSE